MVYKMTVRGQRTEDSPTCNYECTSKASSSLLKLSTDLPCICDRGAHPRDDGHLTGWGSVAGPKTKHRGVGASRIPRKPFPSRLYEATASDSRSNEFVFRHYQNVGLYMEQYRRDHTVMDTGRTLRQTAEDRVILITPSRPISTPGSDHLRLPSVRGNRSMVSPTAITIKEHRVDNRRRVLCEDTSRGSSRETHSTVWPQCDLPKPSSCTPIFKSKGNRKRQGRRKLGNLGAEAVKSKLIDSYTGGTFVNIVGELRAEVVGSHLKSTGRKRSNLRMNSLGNTASSADRGMNARTYETWDHIWQENFDHSAERTSIGSFNTKGKANTKPGHLQNKPPRHTQNRCDICPDFALEPGKMALTNYYLGSRNFFQANSVVGNNNRHVVTKTRPPISYQRRAPPLSRDTVVVGTGSPFKTEQCYSDK
ncbi:uncharacterized protein LOC110987049 [Acanthaster planci]|uniref:Uncharacterized protein LOC110987049 n=1 Tax=Acanthaster planci TaxID=133434 RepID=A0A8B7ZHM4_ACAPL|nr:uncharacterized protein LOC110987049 [Acanthaster planci]